MPSLDEQIESRREQAKDRRIRERAAVVARYLGSYSSWDEVSKKGHKSFYEQGNLRITDSFSFEDSGDGGGVASGSSITYKGNVVFEEGGSTIRSYVPGSWEGLLTRLYDKAMLIANKKSEEISAEATRKERESEDQEKSRWGL